MTSGKLSKEEINHALELHQKSIVIDCSVVVPTWDESYFDRAQRGGITAHNHTIPDVKANLPETVKIIGDFLRWVRMYDSKCLVAVKANDILNAKHEGKVAFILGPQNANFLEDDLSLVHAFHAIGIRIIQLTYQYRNYIGNGCGESKDCGLSKFGTQIIEEMNKVGIVIDLSHVGPKTTDEAIELSKDPIIFSHSNPKALNPHVRNKTDEQIQAMAEKGGVIGITAYSPICELKKGVRPDVNDYLKHIDYVCDLVGVDHVGIGLDIDETSNPDRWHAFTINYPELSGGYSYEERRVKDLDCITKLPNITIGLVERGYSDNEIKKILGLNFLRVFRRVWGG